MKKVILAICVVLVVGAGSQVMAVTIITEDAAADLFLECRSPDLYRHLSGLGRLSGRRSGSGPPVLR